MTSTWNTEFMAPRNVRRILKAFAGASHEGRHEGPIERHDHTSHESHDSLALGAWAGDHDAHGQAHASERRDPRPFFSAGAQPNFIHYEFFGPTDEILAAA
jgi:hypothetical protein